VTIDQTVEPGIRAECTPTLSDAELCRRGAETLLASWEQYAQGAPGATVWRFADVVSAVFANAPEHGVCNNALLDRGLGVGERAGAISAMEASYEAVGVTHFAAWVHESDDAMRSDLERRGGCLRRPPIDSDGGERVCLRRLPRPGTHPRVHPAAAVRLVTAGTSAAL
jgi:hypothetical protein